ncbi:MAG: FAD binding domain-containing protein [Thermincola sp.]|jgi:4-hydroxybenzoyl-CoA reductase subunit beta|nr:FAD binding domain-containing protein [Thermincola sp.]MDT3701442.1 FAD binding domain-containing protein [Thermincola sp.]
MRLPEFEHLKPRTVAEAVEMLSVHRGEAGIIAGGSDLVIKLKQRLVKFRYLVDLKGISEMSGITSRPDEIEVGALTKLSTIESSPEVLSAVPLLAKAASVVAGPQHRSMGTLGGNICLDNRCYYFNQSLRWRQSRPPCFKTGGDRCYVAAKSSVCHAVYSGDTAPALIALDAWVRIVGPQGNREESLDSIYTGDGKSPVQLQPDEIIKSVVVPIDRPHTGFGYEKYRLREAVDFPVVGVAASISLDRPGGVCVRARIVLNAVGTAPERVVEAENVLIGREIKEAINEAAELAYKSARPIHKMGGSPYHKKALVRVLTKRALTALTW